MEHEDDYRPQPLKVKKPLTVLEMFKQMLDRVDRYMFYADTGHWAADAEPDKMRQGIADDLIRMAALLFEIKSPTLRERYEGVKDRAVDWLMYTRELREAVDFDAPVRLPQEMKEAYERG